MSRPLRINLPDLIYHVVNRGNNRQVVFAQDGDYEHYLEILKRYKEKFQEQINALVSRSKKRARGRPRVR